MDTTTLLPTLGAQAGPGGAAAGAGPGDHPVRRPALPGLGRPRPAGARIVREAFTFGAIGVVSTLAYAALYLVLRGWMDAAAANAVSLVITAVGNTAANRRLTFGVRGRASMIRDQVAGLAAFGIALGLTSASIAALDLVVPDAGHVVELAALVAANVAATVTRFLLLRAWIPRDARRTALPAAAGAPAARPALRPAPVERIVR